MTEIAAAARPRPQRRVRIVLAGVAWVVLIACWVVHQRRTGLGAVDTAQRLIDTARGNWWAIVAYMAVSLIRRPGDESVVSSRLGTWSSRLRANSFEAVLLTRLLFVPYDLVNYGCGLLRVRRTPFIIATAIGTLPGTVAFVLVGSSVTRLDGVSTASTAEH